MTLYTMLLSPILAFAILTPQEGQAEGGKLPRGTVKKSNVKEIPSTPVNYCGVGLTQKHGSTGVFSKSGRYFFLLRKTEKKGSTASPKYRYNILQFDLEKNVASTLFASNLQEVHAMIPHGEPIRGFTFISFDKSGRDCKLGPASYLTVNLLPSNKPNAPKAFKNNDSLTLVESKTGPLLFDIEKNNLLDLDLASFQMRGIHVKGIGKERPIYASKNGSTVFTWSNGSPEMQNNFGVSLYRASSSAVAKMKLNSDDMLMQDKAQFVVAQFYPDENILLIKELLKWSRTNRVADYQTKLPQRYKVLEAEYAIDIKNHRLIISGGTRRAKLDWRKAFVYDYHAGQPYTELKSGDDIIAEAGFSHDKDWTYFILESPETSLTTGAKLFSTKTGKWSEFQLPNPK